MHWKQLRNRKPYDMSAQLSTNYQDNEKQSISFSRGMAQKYFSATQTALSRAAPCCASVPKVGSSRSAAIWTDEPWNVPLEDFVLDSLAKKLTAPCTGENN